MLGEFCELYDVNHWVYFCFRLEDTGPDLVLRVRFMQYNITFQFILVNGYIKLVYVGTEFMCIAILLQIHSD